MGHLRHFGNKVVWASVGAVVVAGALLASTMLASAAAPNLPRKTPAQLLAAIAHAKLPSAMTAVLSENADLGFPALPDIAGLPSSALSAASWLAGSHTVQIWYSGSRHVRIAVPVSFGETDLRVNGSQVWLWQSQGQIATHLVLAQPGRVGPLWRFSHLRPAQIAHVPAFLKQRVRVPLSAPPVPPGTAPASLKRQVLLHLGATCSVPPGLQIIKSLGDNGGGVIHVSKGQLSLKVPPARLRALRSRTFAISKTLHISMAKALPISLWQASAYSHLKAAPPVAVGVLKAITPLQAAQRLLARLGPTTKVTVAGTTVVAGRPAYQLSVEPRSNRSLIGQILIAVDAKSYLPLQVQVIPRGSSSAAFSIGYTTFTPGQPAASNFAFTPPPGARVHVVKLSSPLAGLTGLPGVMSLVGVSSAFAGQAGAPIVSFHVASSASPGAVPVPTSAMPGPPGAAPGVHVHVVKLHGSVSKISVSKSYVTKINSIIKFSAKVPLRSFCSRRLAGVAAPPSVATLLPAGPRVLGSGWLSVLEIPAGQALAGLSGGSRSAIVKPGAHGSPAPVAGGQAMAMLRLLLNSATRVHGSWGSGRLISTRLVNILITSKGQVLIGAVTPAVLYADAAKVR